ncbi:MAG: hypothetical protein LBK46_02800 [Oscillospiraceae bacterium]|jgi:hypothetical protein|nr:hypothetical protein [Oscillospiraceae bacterium]
MAQYSNFWERVAYDSGLADRLLQGGRQEERIEIVKNLIALGVSIDFIAKGTGLSIEQLTQLSVQPPARPTAVLTAPKKRTSKPKTEE